MIKGWTVMMPYLKLLSLVSSIAGIFFLDLYEYLRKWTFFPFWICMIWSIGFLAVETQKGVDAIIANILCVQLG